MIRKRIQALREHLTRHDLDAYIIPSTDPHQSEYLPDCWQRRAFVSGFTGSAGDLIVTSRKAGLWADSRYWIQAAEQLQGTGITLFKMGLPQTPHMFQWLRDDLPEGATVGFDPQVLSHDLTDKLRLVLKPKKIAIKSIAENLVDLIWEDRPEPPHAPVAVHPEELAGESSTVKLEKLREKMKQKGADAHVVTALDAIAWLFNIRGGDVRFNPLVIAYAVVTIDGAGLFIDPMKTGDELREHLKGLVSLHGYDGFRTHLAKLADSGRKVLLDKETVSQWVVERLAGCEILFDRSPITLLKAVKNPREIAGMKAAHERDGRAVTRFLCWLKDAVATGGVTELTAARKLESMRSEEALYRGPSFETISAYGAHGAIVHYAADEESDAVLEPRGIYLIDSGGQYLDGTTDITRTVALGEPNAEQRDRFTRVLKGHIALARTSFPAGTVGKQLDTVARKPLWEEGLNYGHGTGHGVGAYLCVHEGPHVISPFKCTDVSLVEGMVTSNEPGYYKAGEYGIRIENLMYVARDRERSGEETPFYRLENLTCCPIDLSLVDTDLLTEDEVSYLNEYHRQTRDKLSPQLKFEERVWLEEATRELVK